jgi:hypothetical protein
MGVRKQCSNKYRLRLVPHRAVALLEAGHTVSERKRCDFLPPSYRREADGQRSTAIQPLLLKDLPHGGRFGQEDPPPNVSRLHEAKIETIPCYLSAPSYQPEPFARSPPDIDRLISRNVIE